MPKKRILTDFRLDKISAVDNPCQEGARVAIIKREFSQEERDRLSDTGAAMPDGSFPIKTTTDLKNAIHAIGRANNPEAVKRHIIRRARALGATDMLPENWGMHKKEYEMTKEEYDEAIAKLKVEHKTALDTLTAQVAKIQADLYAANVLAKMSDEDKEYMAGEADEGKRKSFLAATPEVRKDLINKRKAADETVVVAGVTVKKSLVGEATFSILKAQQKQIEEGAEAIRKANEASENAIIAKRVQDEFASLAGKPEDTVKVLKFVNNAPADVKAALDTILKSAQQLAKRAFERLGHGDGQEIKKGQKPFNDAVDKIMVRDKISKSKAMVKAAEEHPDLYKAFQEAGTQLAQIAA